MTFARLLIALLALLLVTAPAQAARYAHHPIVVAQRDQGGNGGISLDQACLLYTSDAADDYFWV